MEINQIKEALIEEFDPDMRYEGKQVISTINGFFEQFPREY